MSIEVNDLCFEYPHKKHVLHNVSFRVTEGELLAVLGPNGVGKSTLFRCILGLLKGSSGACRVDGYDTWKMKAGELAKLIAYIPQFHFPSFDFSVIDMVLMGTTAGVGRFSTPGKEEIERAEAALCRIGIQDLRNRSYMHISGGEQQLTLIARGLAQNARNLIMDEPTASLDYGNRIRVLTKIRTLTEDGYTIIQSTHSPEDAFRYSDRVIALKDGVVAGFGPPEEVMTEPLVSKLYGVDVEIFKPPGGGPSVCIPRDGRHK